MHARCPRNCNGHSENLHGFRGKVQKRKRLLLDLSAMACQLRVDSGIASGSFFGSAFQTGHWTAMCMGTFKGNGRNCENGWNSLVFCLQNCSNLNGCLCHKCQSTRPGENETFTGKSVLIEYVVWGVPIGDLSLAGVFSSMNVTKVLDCTHWAIPWIWYTL